MSWQHALLTFKRCSKKKKSKYSRTSTHINKFMNYDFEGELFQMIMSNSHWAERLILNNKRLLILELKDEEKDVTFLEDSDEWGYENNRVTLCGPRCIQIGFYNPRQQFITELKITFHGNTKSMKISEGMSNSDVITIFDRLLGSLL